MATVSRAVSGPVGGGSFAINLNDGVPRTIFSTVGSQTAVVSVSGTVTAYTSGIFGGPAPGSTATFYLRFNGSTVYSQSVTVAGGGSGGAGYTQSASFNSGSLNVPFGTTVSVYCDQQANGGGTYTLYAPLLTKYSG